MTHTTPCCEYCGAEKPDTVTFGELSATYNSHVLRYKGERMVGFQPGEVRILWTLMRRGLAAFDALAMTTPSGGEFCSNTVVRQRICTIRRKFKAADVPYQIKSLSGYGYEIRPIKP